jgi:MinD-like ATPase involved in chromosome partitioning or flagellar assembly
MGENNHISKPGFARRLSVIMAGDDGLPQTDLAVEIASCAAHKGQSVLLIDCGGQNMAKQFGVVLKSTLQDVLEDKASLEQAKHISPDGKLSLTVSGDAPLENLLGALAAMSLSHDLTIVIAPAGCTPAHVRLAAAADHCALLFSSQGDRFMRAYWTLDAIRSRAPKCDPAMVVISEAGRPRDEAHEAYEMLAHSVREFLGAPPPLAGICRHGQSLATLAVTMVDDMTATRLDVKVA